MVKLYSQAFELFAGIFKNGSGIHKRSRIIERIWEVVNLAKVVLALDNNKIYMGGYLSNFLLYFSLKG